MRYKRLTFASGLYGALAYGYDAIGNRTSQSGGRTKLARPTAMPPTATSSCPWRMAARRAASPTRRSAASGQRQPPQRHGAELYLRSQRPHGSGRRTRTSLWRRTPTIFSGSARPRLRHRRSRSPSMIALDTCLLEATGLQARRRRSMCGSATCHWRWSRRAILLLPPPGSSEHPTEGDRCEPEPCLGHCPATLRPDRAADLPAALNLRSPGQYLDTETGMHQNWFRDYDPTTGRYIESDPIGLGGGLNTFAYAEGNPLTFVDSLGLQPDWICWRFPVTCLALKLVSPRPNALTCKVDPANPLPPFLNSKPVPPPPTLPNFDFNDPKKPPTNPDGKKWDWHGPDAPGGDRGAWVNPDDPDQSVHPDIDHPPPVGPNWNSMIAMLLVRDGGWILKVR